MTRTQHRSGLLALLALAGITALPKEAAAQVGTPSRPTLDCTKYPNCESAQWEINKAGYALIASLPAVETYLVCMAHVGPTERFFSVYIKVDNKIINHGTATLGAPIVSAGCTTVQGKVIEVINTGGAPIGRIQGFYRRLTNTRTFVMAYPWNAPPTGVVGQPGATAPIYTGPVTTLARICFAGSDAESSNFWANQRNLVVNGVPLRRGDATVAVFSRHTCVDTGNVTSSFAWRDFDGNEAFPVGGSFMFTVP